MSDDNSGHRDSTSVLHEQVLKLFVTLLSTQLMSPISMDDPEASATPSPTNLVPKNLFLDLAMDPAVLDYKRYLVYFLRFLCTFFAH